MTAVKQRAINIINVMPDEEVEKFVTLNIRYEQSETKEVDEFAKYEEHMKQSRQWAKEVGLTADDITRAIKNVRQKKREMV